MCIHTYICNLNINYVYIPMLKRFNFEDFRPLHHLLQRCVQCDIGVTHHVMEIFSQQAMVDALERRVWSFDVVEETELGNEDCFQNSRRLSKAQANMS